MHEYIRQFQEMGFGLFVHFGLYSVLGKGEWFASANKMDIAQYNALTEQFDIAPDWAEKLVQTAKQAGCRYITLTTRHHDGFSLYDTRGLTDFDAPHSACGRDLIREFVDACREADIVPFFYHTLLDWYNPDYRHNFPGYIDYLEKSLEILCTRYGKIGGLWFDGMWDKPEENWQEDRIYGMIRTHQPDAMIINNTGLDAMGQTGHPEIDSVTFERGKPFPIVTKGKPIAGEVCQGITDHWGYAAQDIAFKSVRELLDTLIDCRVCGCNLLLNTGLMGNGYVNPSEQAILQAMGTWIRANRETVYRWRPADIQAENADVVTDGKYYYAIVRDVPMCYVTKVARAKEAQHIVLHTKRKIQDAIWLDNGKPISVNTDGSFESCPFEYGVSLYARVARFQLESEDK